MDDVGKLQILTQAEKIMTDWYTYINDGMQYDVESGLCTNIKYNVSMTDTGATQYELNRIFQQWPKYSGNPDYPVPHPHYNSENSLHSAGDMAREAYSEYPLYTGVYGELRRELLDFMIETLTSEIV